MVGQIWDLIALQPMVNVLIVLSDYLLSSFGLSVLVLTLVTRLLLYPLTIKQIRSTKHMQELQPQLTELQKKYTKDKQKLGQEQMRLYKESGLSPAGCLLPMLAQFPIWIALYQSIIRLLAIVPEDFLGLSRFLYSWPLVYSTVPLNSSFLWMDLSVPDTLLALLVGASMWVQQKMVQPQTQDPKQRSQSQMMLWMMPLMFTFLAMSFPSGLALYWVISNAITIGIQYFSTGGWGSLLPGAATKPTGSRDTKYKKRIAQVEQGSHEGADLSADIIESTSTEEKGLSDGKSGSERQDRGRSYPPSIRTTKRKPRRGRGNRR
ncbi:YidC/Oxa1 family membrane protein insertase [Chloroflexota bacterium]